MNRFYAILLSALLLSGCASQVEAEPQLTEVFSPSVPVTTEAPTEPPAPEILMLDAMTTEEKIGQLFLARCPESGQLEQIQSYHPGGYILFGRDFAQEDPDTIRDKIAGYQSTSTIPMLIAVDEEDGTVTRVSSCPAFRTSRFPSPRTAYDQGGLEQVMAIESEKCQLLSSLGINVNMAPVCDITTNPESFMYKRSLGQSPEVTSAFVSGCIAIAKEHHIGTVLKHFPGYGNNADTHTGIAVDNRTLEALESHDLIPFQQGIDAGCGAILISHTIVNCLDESLPASLSPAVHSYLRENMGFEGVIITDDLIMQAIADLYGDEEAAVMAVLAGNDILCSSNCTIQYEVIQQAVEDGRIPMDILDNAVLRILRWKMDLGLIQ